jgi:LCP family protein required for cell wall assembly
LANDSFIDGLRPRSEKMKEASSAGLKGSRFSSGYTSIEFGDSSMSRTNRRQIDKIVEQTKLVKKAPAPKHTSRPKSYARDVLGIEEDEFEFDSEDIKRAKRDYKKEKSKNRKRRNKKKFIFRHKFFSFIVVPIFVLGLVAYFWGDSIMLKITNGQSGLFDFLRTVVSGNATLKTGSDGRTNILIFGTSGYDMAGNEAGGVHDGAQLTDSIMVLSVDQNTKDVAMISLPRDLKTDTCTATSKINELYYCENKDNNNEAGGAKKLRDRVSEILGIEIQYYAHINWMSLIQIVDAIGGVTVTIDDDINDDWTKTYIKAGVPVELNGEQALGLARARHGTANGDFTRGDSQQKIMIAIKEKISTMNFNIGDLVNLANILGDNLRSDFTSDAIYAAAKVVSEQEFESIRQIPLIGSGTNYFTTGEIRRISYVLPTAGDGNYTNIRKYVKQALLKNPVILENAQIVVLNGSGVPGIEEEEKKELERSIFNVKEVGNAPAAQYFNKIYLYEITDKPATKEKLEMYYNVKALAKEALPSGVNTDGIDFVIILGVGYSAD